MTQKLSYDELLRLIWQARDIMAAHTESMDEIIRKRQNDWLNDVNPLLTDFDPNRPISPLAVALAAISHMTPEEHARIAKAAKEIVERADREVQRYKKNGSMLI